MRLAYGTGSIAVADRLFRNARILRPQTPRRLSVRVLRRALRSVAQWARRGTRILVVVPDATRYAAADRILPALRLALDVAGVSDEQVELLFASGLHRPPSAAERAEIAGREIAAAWRTRALDDFVEIGRVGDVRIEVARAAVDAERVLLLSAAGFHYLAGFSGGWKMLFPGCASERTILGLHRATLGTGAEPGRLEDNPFQNAIRAAGALMRVPVRSIHAAVGPGRRLLSIDAGRPDASLRRAANKCRRWFRVRLARPADCALVSAGGHPKDIDLIQAHKAIEHASRAVRPGGRIVVLAKCPDGFGYPGFERWFDFRTPVQLRQSLEKRFHVYGRTAWSLWSKAKRYRITLVSSLPPDLVRRMGMEPASGVPPLPRDGSLCVIPDAGWVLPVCGRARG